MSSEKTLIASDIFRAEITSKLSTRAESIRKIRTIFQSLGTMATIDDISAADIRAAERLVIKLLELVASLKSRERFLPGIARTLTPTLALLASRCREAGSPSLEARVYSLIGDMYIRVAELAEMYLSGYEVLELRNPATFWYMKSDHASLRRPSLNQRVFQKRTSISLSTTRLDDSLPKTRAAQLAGGRQQERDSGRRDRGLIDTSLLAVSKTEDKNDWHRQPLLEATSSWQTGLAQEPNLTRPTTPDKTQHDLSGPSPDLFSSAFYDSVSHGAETLLKPNHRKKEFFSGRDIAHKPEPRPNIYGSMTSKEF